MALQKLINGDKKLPKLAAKYNFTLCLGMRISDTGKTFRLLFKNGRIIEIQSAVGHCSMIISGSMQTWKAVFNGIMDPFVAIIQKKMVFDGEMKHYLL